MSTLAPVRITAEQFLACEDYDGYELVDGEPVEVPMGSLSAWVSGEMFGALRVAVRQSGGVLYPQDTAIKAWPLRPNHMRKPDGMYFAPGRIPGDIPPEGTLEIAPDLAIEVVSPTDNARDLDTKIHEYLDVGVRLIWVVYPDTKSIVVHRPGGLAARLAAVDTLTGEDVLPGFAVQVAALFPAGSRANA